MGIPPGHAGDTRGDSLMSRDSSYNISERSVGQIPAPIHGARPRVDMTYDYSLDENARLGSRRARGRGRRTNVVGDDVVGGETLEEIEVEVVEIVGPPSASMSISPSSELPVRASSAWEAADVDVVGDVVRKARGELAEVLEFESRGFELERALIAGLDDGSVGEGPEVAPAELAYLYPSRPMSSGRPDFATVARSISPSGVHSSKTTWPLRFMG